MVSISSSVRRAFDVADVLIINLGLHGSRADNSHRSLGSGTGVCFNRLGRVVQQSAWPCRHAVSQTALCLRWSSQEIMARCAHVHVTVLSITGTPRAADLTTVVIAEPSRREADNAAEQAPLRLRQPSKTWLGLRM